MSTSHASVKKLVDAHFAGRISKERERELRSHLAACGACRGYYDRHLLLAELDPAAKPPEQRLAIGLGLAGDAKPPRLGTLGWAGGLAAAFVAVLALLPLRGKRADEFAARGSMGTLEPQLLVYQVPRGQRPEAPGAALRTTDELAFAYANAPGFQRLMIFGVDEHRHVYWYHPAWSDASLDPHAIEIARGADVHEIPEAIRHPVDGHELTVFAVFTNEDLSVHKVEQMIRESGSVDTPLPIQGSFQKQLHFDITR